MRDLIDRKALKDYVSSLSTHPLNEWDTWGVIAAIDKQPTVAAPRWHRVEVEEPTKAGWYLVMDEDGDFNVDEWHNTFGWRFVTPFDADRITHWMPIEPPKEDA